MASSSSSSSPSPFPSLSSPVSLAATSALSFLAGIGASYLFRSPSKKDTKEDATGVNPLLNLVPLSPTDDYFQRCDHPDVREQAFLQSLATVDFGSDACKRLFLLNSTEFLLLNHGSYGALPKYVYEKMKQLTEEIETCPDKWFRHHSLGETIKFVRAVSALLNADEEGIVTTMNATASINAVVRSLETSGHMEKGDKVLTLNITYGAIKNCIVNSANKFDWRVVEVPVSFPVASAQSLLDAVEDEIKKHNGTVAGKGTGSTEQNTRDAKDSDCKKKGIKFAVFDHITSGTGGILPAKELVALCRKYDILTLIDGAHSIGQVPLDMHGKLKAYGCLVVRWCLGYISDIESCLSFIFRSFRVDMQPDFFTSNMHKWMFSPKGSAVLYVDR